MVSVAAQDRVQNNVPVTLERSLVYMLPLAILYVKSTRVACRLGKHSASTEIKLGRYVTPVSKRRNKFAIKRAERVKV